MSNHRYIASQTFHRFIMLSRKFYRATLRSQFRLQLWWLCMPTYLSLYTYKHIVHDSIDLRPFLGSIFKPHPFHFNHRRHEHVMLCNVECIMLHDRTSIQFWFGNAFAECIVTLSILSLTLSLSLSVSVSLSIYLYIQRERETSCTLAMRPHIMKHNAPNIAHHNVLVTPVT